MGSDAIGLVDVALGVKDVGDFAHGDGAGSLVAGLSERSRRAIKDISRTDHIAQPHQTRGTVQVQPRPVHRIAIFASVPFRQQPILTRAFANCFGALRANTKQVVGRHRVLHLDPVDRRFDEVQRRQGRFGARLIAKVTGAGPGGAVEQVGCSVSYQRQPRGFQPM